MELEVFQQFKPKLITAISDSVLKIAVKCQARGFISVLTYEKIVHKENTSIQQATLLVNVVDKCITTDCANFEVFVDILDDELPPACKKPLSEMCELLKSLRDRRTFRLCTDDKMPSKNSVVDVPKSPIKTMKQKFHKPGRSNSSKTLAHSISTDSGISFGRSDSSVSDRDVSLLKLNSTQYEDLTPIEETPLDNDNHHQSSGVTSTTSPPIASSKLSDKMLSVEQDVRNLRYETMQKEAVELSLRDNIKQLRNELDRTVREKQEAEEELRIKQREVEDLTNALECEKRKLEKKTEEVDGLKSRIAGGEASKEKLKKRVDDINRQLLTQESKHEDDILAYQLEATSLQATIEEKKRIICELRSRIHVLEHGNVLLQRSNSYKPDEEHEVDVVVVQRSDSNDLRGEVKLKSAKLRETEEKLLKCEQQLSQEQNRQSNMEKKLLQRKEQLSKQQNRQSTYILFIGLLVVVIAIVVYLYIYHRDNVCFVRDIPM